MKGSYAVSFTRPLLSLQFSAVATVLIVGAAGALPAFGQGEPSVAGMRSDHVLRIFDSVELESGATVVDEAMIFRDGLTVLRRTGTDFDAIVGRGQASEEDITRLKQVLIEERVDRLQGDCEIAGLPSVQPVEGEVTSRQTLLSWFGVEGRRSRHMEIREPRLDEPDPEANPCSESLTRVASEAVAFTELALSGPDVTFDPDMNYPRSLLYEIESQFTSDPDCEPHAFSDTYLLFRDGLLLRRFQGSDGLFEFTRGVVQQNVRARLNEVLSEEIRDLRGVCRTWFLLPFTVDGACIDYDWASGATWFGRQGRMTTLLGHEGVDRQCRDGQLRVRNQLMVLLINTLAASSNHTVTGFFAVEP